MKKTQTEKLNAKNAKAVVKHRKAVTETGELHKRIAAGELTAGEALLQKGAGVPTKDIKAKKAKKPVEVTVTSTKWNDDGKTFVLETSDGKSYEMTVLECVGNYIMVNEAQLRDARTDLEKDLWDEQNFANATEAERKRLETLASLAPTFGPSINEINKTSKTPKASKPKASGPSGKDPFGSRLGSTSSQLNMAVIGSKKPATADSMAQATGIDLGRCKAHIKWLLQRDLIKVEGKGYVPAK